MISKRDAAFSERIFPQERICLWAAGVSSRIIAFLPSEKHLYVSIGAGVLLTSIMAAISGYFCFDLVLAGQENGDVKPEHVIPLALFWAILIGNLDRSIVCNTQPWSSPGNAIGKFLLLITRLILAILISFVVSVPLELKLFEKRLDEEIEKIASANLEEKAKEAKNQYDLAVQSRADAIKKAEERLNGQVSPNAKEPTLRETESAKRIEVEITGLTEREAKQQKNLEATRTRVAQFEAIDESRRSKTWAEDHRKAVKNEEDALSALTGIQQTAAKMQETLKAALDKETTAIDKQRTGQEIASTVAAVKKDEDESVAKRMAVYSALLEEEKKTLNTTTSKDLLIQVTALERIKEPAVTYTKWLIRSLIIVIEIIPIFLKLYSRVKHYDELTTAISEANKDLCMDMVLQQSAATKAAYGAANLLRTEAITKNQPIIIEATSDMIRKEVDEWKDAKTPRARVFWHNLRVITDQLFPGRFADYNKGAEAREEGDPPNSLLAAFTPTSTLIFSMLLVVSGIATRIVSGDGGNDLPKWAIIAGVAGVGVAIGFLFDYLRTTVNRLSSYQAMPAGNPPENTRGADSESRRWRANLGFSALMALLIFTSWNASKVVAPKQTTGKSQSAAAAKSENEKPFLEKNGLQMLGFVVASVVAMISKISKDEDP